MLKNIALGLSAALLALVFVGRSADAAVLRYDVSSTCVSDCGLIGLNPGDAVGGFLVLDTSTAIPDSSFDYSLGGSNPVELLEFSMTFGNISIDSSSAVGTLLFMSFGASVNVLERFGLFAAEALSPDTGEGFQIHGGPISYSALAAAPDTRCNNADCRSFLILGEFATFAPFNAPVTGVPVQLPLPATAPILLGSLGLLALLIVGRKAASNHAMAAPAV